MCSKNRSGIFKSWESTVRKKQAAAKKRVLTNLFSTMSVASVDDDITDSAASSVISQTEEERKLPNGDIYTGQFSSDNIPHGHGKYTWTDGCIYVGDWHRGRATGKGNFFWPSGATYEGMFKSGFMEGKGTYMMDPSAGNTSSYRGNWVMNLKHGQGTNTYSNGDYYQGDWKRGLQDGQGKYQWNNGNNYIGEWKSGKMNGTGTLTWSNGNRYEGLWEDGIPKGNGTFTNAAAGGSYVGVWSNELEKLSVTYQSISESSSSSSSSSLENNNNNNMEEWDPQQLYDVELQSCSISPEEKLPLVPSQKMPATWETTNVSRPPRRMRTAHQEGRLSNYSSSSENSDQSRARIGIGRQLLRVRTGKRQGETISKGHKNYELMLNLQLGIRHSVGKHPPPKSLELKSSSFDPKEKVWTKFPPEGSKRTPPHQSCEFRWKDYCPLVFRTLRLLFKVDPADYMLSICGNEALRELSSPGKSGSFFYMTSDDRYMIKTVKKAEVKVLIRMLKEYYNHVRSFDNTLVTKFYGLHCVKLPGPSQKKVRFVIMGNLFDSGHTIHRRFDLKGSSHGRITEKPESEIDANTTLKDLDLNFIFRLQQSWFQELCKQVDKDCEFLKKARIMDYSLLVGLHFRNVTYNNDTQMNEACPCSAIQDNDSDGEERAWNDRWEIKMGLNMPAQAELTVRRREGGESLVQLVGEPTGELYQVILTFGIIDILQDYDITKKLEHAYKSIQYDPTSISAVDPRQYSKRFRDFIFRVFVEDT